MKFEDIPTLRERFRKIDMDRIDRIKRLPPISEIGDIKYNEWKRDKEVGQINTEARKEERELCKRVFGSYLSSYDVDPDDVLDWIEHFMKAEEVA
jgi:hypothetical protein